MTVIMNIPATLICDKCNKSVETCIPVSNSGGYPLGIITMCKNGYFCKYDLGRCPAVGEGWHVKLDYGPWKALCPDCKEADE